MQRIFSRQYCCISSQGPQSGLFSLTLRLVVAIFIALSALAVAPSAYAQGVHVVRRGENLAVIARAHGVTVRDLMASNGITNANLIYVGQRLVVPGSGGAQTTSSALPGGDGYYVVRRGESLSSIAAAYGMTISDLMRLNGINNANMVYVGQRLRVSARVAPVSVQNAPDPSLAHDIYVVRTGDTLSTIAQAFGTTPQALMVANGLPNANFVWVGQRLRIQAAPAVQATLGATGRSGGARWIEVNLSAQTLNAWEGDTLVMSTNISSGLPATPTVTGRFRVGNKYAAQHMSGPGYSLPNVPWVMYFYGAYAIHGAYWHNNFGAPMSHGCVNMRPGEAEMLYNWAPAGTEVYVHY
jgi:LysM repeat protein